MHFVAAYGKCAYPSADGVFVMSGDGRIKRTAY
jgi:hypothetical protein